MHGWSDPSFFFTKKNPAPAGDEEGRIRPDFRESSMYSFMAFFAGVEMEYNLPFGREAPGMRSMGPS